jgi:predicted  nucleic acid-binding Zn-ribbon protein
MTDTINSMTEPDTITNELNKLLNETDTEYKKNNSEYDSSYNMSSNSVDIISVISELRIDTLKLLEMLNVINTEIDKQKEKIGYLSSKLNTVTEEFHKFTKQTSEKLISIDSIKKDIYSESATDAYQENIDRILSLKLDEFTVRAEKKLAEMDKFMMDTRTIATRKRGPSLT